MTEDDIRRSPITCRAKVGHPAGNLVLKILKPNETEFQYVDFNEQTTVPYSCMMEIHGTYYPSPDLVINASTVSCQVLPHKPLKGVSDDDLTVNGMVTFIPGTGLILTSIIIYERPLKSPHCSNGLYNAMFSFMFFYF